MTRPLPRAAVAGKPKPKPKPKRGGENPGITATRRVFFPSLRVHRAAIQGGGPLLAGEDTIHTHTKNPKPHQNKPTTTLQFKALSQGSDSKCQSDEDVTAHAGEDTSSQSLYSSWPVLSKKVWIASSTIERIKFRKHFPQVLQRNTLVAAGPSSQKGRNLHIKMYLKSESKIVLSFNTPISSLFTLLLHRNEAT